MYLLPTEKQKNFINLYYGHKASIATLWKYILNKTLTLLLGFIPKNKITTVIGL